MHFIWAVRCLFRPTIMYYHHSKTPTNSSQHFVSNHQHTYLFGLNSKDDWLYLKNAFISNREEEKALKMFNTNIVPTSKTILFLWSKKFPFICRYDLTIHFETWCKQSQQCYAEKGLHKLLLLKVVMCWNMIIEWSFSKVLDLRLWNTVSLSLTKYL